MVYDQRKTYREIEDIFSEADRVTGPGRRIRTSTAYDPSDREDHQPYLSQVVADSNYELARSYAGEPVAVARDNGQGLVSHLEITDEEI